MAIQGRIQNMKRGEDKQMKWLIFFTANACECQSNSQLCQWTVIHHFLSSYLSFSLLLYLPLKQTLYLEQIQSALMMLQCYTFHPYTVSAEISVWSLLSQFLSYYTTNIQSYGGPSWLRFSNLTNATSVDIKLLPKRTLGQYSRRNPTDFISSS